MSDLIETPIQGPRIRESDLCAWFGVATTGERLVYHRGLLANDRAPAFSRLTPRDQRELARVARRAWKLADAGLACLVQRRHGPNDYEYALIVQPRTQKANGDALKRVLAVETGAEEA